ncbi:MAG: glycerol-3-phosphate 1-O-acyltransferase PlsY [Tepidisphaera sp.]|nr:glycerol-3-phosphate 1-O-acyltransferase PlsY [Tepidisphaera sp.]
MIPALLILAAFLAGSIPFGLLIGKAKGVDIRTQGSGNIGATNLGRVLGRRYFFLCFALDALKGFIPTLAGGLVLGAAGRLDLPIQQSAAWLAIMFASVLGHIFCPWLHFKGGKGVATSLGALLGVWPALTLPGLLGLATFALVLLVWRYVSLASIAAAVAIPFGVAAWFHLASIGIGPHPAGAVKVTHMLPYLGLTLLLGALVIWRHRTNIRRLRDGTEPKVGAKSARA